MNVINKKVLNFKVLELVQRQVDATQLERGKRKDPNSDRRKNHIWHRHN